MVFFSLKYILKLVYFKCSCTIPRCSLCSVVKCSYSLQVLESAIKVYKIINCSHHNKSSPIKSVPQYGITTNCYSNVEINPHRHSV